MGAKNKVFRDVVSNRMLVLAKIAESVGIKNEVDVWEIRAGSPTHKQDWKLLAWSNGQPIEIPFLDHGHLGWTAREAATALDFIGRAFTALKEMYGEDV